MFNNVISRNNESILWKEDDHYHWFDEKNQHDFYDKIIELREFDVKYYNWVCIDNEIWVA